LEAKDEVELDGVEAERRGPLDGVLDQAPPEAAPTPGGVDDVAGVGDVATEPRAVRLQVVSADEVVAGGRHHHSADPPPHGLVLRRVQRGQLREALAPLDDAGEQRQQPRVVAAPLGQGDRRLVHEVRT